MKKRTYEILLIVALLALVLVPNVLGAERIVYPEGDGVAPTIGLDELKEPGTRIAVLTGSELENTVQDCFPEAKMLAYDTFVDVFAAVDAGKADAALGFDTHIPIVPQSHPQLTQVREPIQEFG